MINGNPNEQLPTAKQRYTHLEKDRVPFLESAHDYARVTIPRLYQAEGSTKRTARQPNQSVGATGCKHLTSKISLSQFPPNTTFFRLYPSEETLAELGLDEEVEAELKMQLDTIALAVTRSLETGSWRSKMIHAVQLLMVGGNVLVYDFRTDYTRIFSLDKYVTRRNGAGDVVEAVVKESLNLSDFAGDKVAQEAIRELLTEKAQAREEDIETKKFDVYTHIRLHEGKHYWRQEVFDKVLESTKSHANATVSPWYFLRWTAIDGEDYGYALIEDLYADLRALGAMNTGVDDWTSAATKFLWLNKFGSQNDIELIAEAESGEVVDGDAEDLQPLSAPVLPNIQVVADRAEKAERELAKTFLMNTSIQRQGERVTAEEIRYMAAEIETVHGGLYTVLSNELQRPLVRRRIKMLTDEGKLSSNLNLDELEPTISTGIEALERGAAYEKTVGWLQDMIQLIGIDQVLAELSSSALLMKTAEARAVDIESLKKTNKEKQAEQQAAQQQQIAEMAGPPMAQEAAKAAFSPEQRQAA